MGVVGADGQTKLVWLIAVNIDDRWWSMMMIIIIIIIIMADSEWLKIVGFDEPSKIQVLLLQLGEWLWKIVDDANYQ